MAGDRPYVVNLTPSLSGCTTQSTPLTARHSSVVGPGAATPQRAMTAGSPQARTAGEAEVVSRRACPPTVPGRGRTRGRGRVGRRRDVDRRRAAGQPGEQDCHAEDAARAP